jgi:putative ABC transport system substrate-binding protein
LHDLVPSATRVAALINPTDAPRAEAVLSDLQAAARSIGVQLQILNASTSREIDAAFAALVRENSRLFIWTGPSLYRRTGHSW